MHSGRAMGDNRDRTSAIVLARLAVAQLAAIACCSVSSFVTGRADDLPGLQFAVRRTRSERSPARCSRVLVVLDAITAGHYDGAEIRPFPPLMGIASVRDSVG